MKPSILIIEPEIYVWGGAERQIVHLANYLTDHNFVVCVLTQRAIPEFKKELKEARIIETGLDTNKLVGTLHNLMPRFDIINPHNHPCELMVFPKKFKTVWQLNEPPLEVLRGEKLPGLYKDIVNKYIDKVVVITDYEKDRSSKIYERDDLIVNYPGVRYDYFSEKVNPKKTREKYKLKDKFVILEAGYITFTKNQVAAVEILAEVKKKIPNAVLVLAGYDKDPYKQQVMSKALDLDVMDDVIFTGYIESDEEMRDLYNIADVYIGPFLDQGGWATTFEAAVTGCPIIVSPDFVAANLVIKHHLGLVKDISEFADVIKVLGTEVNMKTERSNRRKDAEWIRNNLTWEAFGKRYAKIFEEMWHEDEYSYNND
jgi:glycosyltransferase involved in cell wall biosynthesis